ncbi:MAG: VWA domain-containing protein [Pseudomonadota bacterium]|nr:VWA domain-containing protein [Pseudomonadota bacterium]
MIDPRKLDEMLRNADVPEPDSKTRRNTLEETALAFAAAQTQKNIQGSRKSDRLLHDKGAFPRPEHEGGFIMKRKLAVSFAVLAMVVGFMGYTTIHTYDSAKVSDDNTMPQILLAEAEQVTGATIHVQSAPVVKTLKEAKATNGPDAYFTARRNKNEVVDYVATTSDGKGIMSEEAIGFATGAPGIMPMPIPEPIPAPGYKDIGRDKFEELADNPVKLVSEEPVSTFSIDVDTASYSFMRRELNRGVLPQPDSIRIEELVNYFDYTYPLPENLDAPFSITTKVHPTPWKSGTQILHIGIQGYDMAPESRPRANLVFLLDVSGSMNAPDKLPLLKNAFRMLVDTLRPEDSVAIVTYAGADHIALEPTKVAEKGKILAVLDRLGAGGSTAGAAGIRTAYDLAKANFDRFAVNRVILATDGDFNVGITNQNELKGFIERQRESGIFLSVLGFGQGNLNDALMQTLAQNGNGVAAYIDNLNEARKVLVEEAGGALFTIAKDVKIQVEFNPTRVAEYRLIGYVTRKLNREDFNNDAVDAGEIGSGHSVTALYEIAYEGSPATLIDKPRYMGNRTITPDVSLSDEIANVRIRYKLPDTNVSTLIERPVTNEDMADAISDVSGDMRFAASVAAFGQILRGGKYTGSFGFDQVIELAGGAKGADSFGYRAEFVNLVRLAKSARSMGQPR